MKRIYKKPETIVVAVAPVKLLEGSPTPPINPDIPIDGPPLKLNHTTIPSNTEY